MTVKEPISQKDAQPILLSIKHGDKKIKEGKEHMTWCVEQFKKDCFLDHLVVDAPVKNLLHITKTMTNHWKSCGFVNLATNNVTKNYVKSSDHELRQH